MTPMSVLPFLVVMMTVVLIHELGHFLVARWFGVTVEIFSLGFGREILAGNDARGTRWRLGWLPFGGYVKFLDSDSIAAGVFRTKPVWQRALILAAGPFANIAFAVFILAAMNIFVGDLAGAPRIGPISADAPAAKAGLKPGDLITAIDGRSVKTNDTVTTLIGAAGFKPLAVEVDRDGTAMSFSVMPANQTRKLASGETLSWSDIGVRRRQPAVIGTVVAGLPAEESGIEPGDHVVAISGHAIESYDDLVQIVATHAEVQLDITLIRDGVTRHLQVTPVVFRQQNSHGLVTLRGRIGVSCAPTRLGPLPAVGAALHETVALARDILAGIWTALATSSHATEVGGPIAMAKVTGEVAELGIAPLINLTAAISISIALLNLLPIPVLDGGRLVLCAIEALRRRPISRAVEQAAFRVGLAVVLVIFVYVNVTDLVDIGRDWLSKS